MLSLDETLPQDKDDSRSMSGIWPRPRSSVGLAIKGKTLYLYGGYYEIGDRQVTLSDMYELDLGKLDQWKVRDVLRCHGNNDLHFHTARFSSPSPPLSLSTY